MTAKIAGLGDAFMVAFRFAIKFGIAEANYGILISMRVIPMWIISRRIQKRGFT